MDNENRLIIPFVDILLDEILCKVEACTTLKVDRHDVIQEVVLVKDGKRYIRYEDEEGRTLAFDENNSLQSFSIISGIDLIEGDFAHSDLGVSMDISITTAFLKTRDKGQNRLWQSLNVFRPRNVVSKAIEDKTNGNELISGEMRAGAKIKFSPVSIAEKYFPAQVSKFRARQLGISAIEFNYKLRVQNLCTFCIEKA